MSDDIFTFRRHWFIRQPVLDVIGHRAGGRIPVLGPQRHPLETDRLQPARDHGEHGARPGELAPMDLLQDFKEVFLLERRSAAQQVIERRSQTVDIGRRTELVQLAGAAALRRVVTLFDGASDRALAQSDAAVAPAGRFVWIDASVLSARMRDQVLAALLITDADVSGKI